MKLNTSGTAYIHGLVCLNNPLWWNPNAPEWSAYLAEVGRALRAEGPYSDRAVPPALGDNGMDDPPVPSSGSCGAYLDRIIGLSYSPYGE